MKTFLDFVESTAGFTAFSLAAGLLLYMVDVPVKLRVFRGDPARDRPLPSETLEAMLKGSPREKDSLSLYFILTDKYLPEEMRKRVYLFGSLYRIYVDLRVVLVLTFIAAVAGSEVAATHETAFPHSATPPAAVVTVAAMAGGIVVVGLFGIRRHALSYVRKRGGSSSPTFKQTLLSDLKGSAVPAVTVGVLGTTGAVLLAVDHDAVQAAGMAVTIVQASLWVALEVGPPGAGSPATVRDRMLTKMRGRRNDVQYAPVQRLVYDLFTFVPWLVAAAGVNEALGRDPAAILAWSALVFPASVVMSFRKHEERLLGVYREQSVWLEMHKDEIERLKESDLLPDRWD